MASADFLQFVVTAASEPNLPPSARPPLVLTHSFSPCNCLIYWQRFRTAIGREIVWHPCPRCLPYEIPVRQFRDLPAPSFRFHLAVDTLGVRLYPSRCRADSGLSPVGTCARRAHKKAPERLPSRGRLACLVQYVFYSYSMPIFASLGFSCQYRSSTASELLMSMCLMSVR